MRYLLAALLALLAAPASADTLVTKDGKTYRCPSAFGMAEATRTFTCPTYTVEDPDRIEYERDKAVGGAEARPAPAGVSAPPPARAPAAAQLPVAAGRAPDGPAPPPGAAFQVIEVGTDAGAIWRAMENASTLPSETWAVLELGGQVEVGVTAQVLRRDKIVIRSAEGKRGSFDCTRMGPWWGGKACLILQKSEVVIENVDFFGARRQSNTSAIFAERDVAFAVRGVRAWNNHNGVLTSPGCSVLIEDSEFWDNGSGDDLTHNLYLNCAKATVRRVKSYFTGWGKTVQVLDAASGEMEDAQAPIPGVHGLKSRTFSLLVEDSDIMAGRGAAIDVPYGGQVVIRNTTLRRPDGPYGNILMLGMEAIEGRRCPRGDGPTRLENVTIVIERSIGAMVNACPSPGYVAGGSIPSSVNMSGLVQQ